MIKYDLFNGKSDNIRPKSSCAFEPPTNIPETLDGWWYLGSRVGGQPQKE